MKDTEKSNIQIWKASVVSWNSPSSRTILVIFERLVSVRTVQCSASRICVFLSVLNSWLRAKGQSRHWTASLTDEASLRWSPILSAITRIPNIPHVRHIAAASKRLPIENLLLTFKSASDPLIDFEYPVWYIVTVNAWLRQQQTLNRQSMEDNRVDNCQAWKMKFPILSSSL